MTTLLLSHSSTKRLNGFGELVAARWTSRFPDRCQISALGRPVALKSRFLSISYVVAWLLTLVGGASLYAQGKGYWRLVNVTQREKHELGPNGAPWAHDVKGQRGNVTVMTMVNDRTKPEAQREQVVSLHTWTDLPAALVPDKVLQFRAVIKVLRRANLPGGETGWNGTSLTWPGGGWGIWLNTGCDSAGRSRNLEYDSATSTDPKRAPGWNREGVLHMEVKAGGGEDYLLYSYNYEWVANAVPAGVR